MPPYFQRVFFFFPTKWEDEVILWNIKYHTKLHKLEQCTGLLSNCLFTQCFLLFYDLFILNNISEFSLLHSLEKAWKYLHLKKSDIKKKKKRKTNHHWDPSCLLKVAFFIYLFFLWAIIFFKSQYIFVWPLALTVCHNFSLHYVTLTSDLKKNTY